MIDCEVRQESLKFSGEPVMLQLSLGPCYVRTLALQHVSMSVFAHVGSHFSQIRFNIYLQGLDGA